MWCLRNGHGFHQQCRSGEKFLSSYMLLQSDDNCLLAQVMKLAVRYKRKAVTFVSSVGVAMSLGKTGVKEDSLGTNIAEEFPGSEGYAVG